MARALGIAEDALYLEVDAKLSLFSFVCTLCVTLGVETRVANTMATSSNPFSGLQRSVKTLVIMSWLFFNLLTITCAQRTLITSSLRNDVPSRVISTEDAFALSSGTENADVFLGRDLSPGLSTSSAPSSLFQENDKAESLLTEKRLSLRSSSHNVSGIRGYPIYALPILSSELAEILNTAQADLRTHNNHVFDSLYHVNTTKWSFIVVSANRTLHYTSILSIVSRFMKLSSKTAAPHDIVFTRVGAVLDGTNVVADITIMPHRTITNSSYVPFSNFGHHQLPTSQPEEIMRITPSGSTCAYQFVNETAALAPFRGHDAHIHQNLTARSLETEIARRIGETMYILSMNVWRRPDGLPVEVKVWAIKAVLYVASWQLLCGASLAVFDMPSMAKFKGGGSFIEEWGFDTGFYVVGRLMARFAINNTSGAKDPLTMSLTIWLNFLEMVLEPLEEMGAHDNTWALEGKVYGPGNATSVGNSAKEEEGKERENAVAQWQIWLGDYDE